MNFFERQKQRKKQQLLNDVKNKQQMEEYRANQSALGLGTNAGKLGYDAIKGAKSTPDFNVLGGVYKNSLTDLDSVGSIGNSMAQEGAKQATSAIGKEATKEATKKIATEGLKKGLGKAMPIVGGAMSAKSAYDRAKQGDYVGAGLDAVAGVASFVPGIGTAIAMGAQALNAMKDLKKADEMKAIAKSQEAIAENQASALGNLADKKQEIKAQQQDNLADMQLQTQPDMSSTLSNEINSQIDAFAPNPTESAVVEPASMLTQNTQLPQMVNPTFDTPQPQPVATPEQDKTGMVANILNYVKGMAGKVDNTVDLTQDKIGGMVDKAVAKVKPGLSDFMAGYQDNRNTSFTQGDLYKQIKPQDNGMFAQGNIDLANRPVVKNEDGTISTVKSMSFEPSEGEYAGKQVLIPMVADNGTMMNEEQAIQYFNQNGKHLGVFNDVDSANKYADSLHNQQDVYYNGENASPVLKGGAEEIKKSIMTKLGEMAGTTTRLASNPYVQGLVAGGIYKATGGDAGESIKYGVDWGMNKAKSDMYAKNMGKEPSIMPIYTDDTYKALNDATIKRNKLEADFKKHFQTNQEYLAQQFASGLMTEEQIKNIMNSPDYNPNALVNINAIKAGTGAKNANTNEYKADVTAEHYKNQDKVAQQNANTKEKLANSTINYHINKIIQGNKALTLKEKEIVTKVFNYDLKNSDSFYKAMQEAEKMDNPEKAEHMKRQAMGKRKLDIILPQWIEQYGEEDAMQLYNEQLMGILQ